MYTHDMKTVDLILKISPWVLVIGLIAYIMLSKSDTSYKELSEKYKEERDHWMEISVWNIKHADSLGKVVKVMNKEIDSLNKLSRQYDNKLIAIKKYYEKRYTDVSNNTPTESYRLFTDYTNTRHNVPD